MYLLAAYSLAAAAWTLAANFGNAPHSLPIWFNGAFYGDKVVHFLAVGLFSVVAARAFRSIGVIPLRAIGLGMALAFFLSTLEEATNAVLPNRSCSVADLAANYAGVVVLSGLAGARYLAPWLLRWRPLTSGRQHAYAG